MGCLFVCLLILRKKLKKEGELDESSSILFDNRYFDTFDVIKEIYGYIFKQTLKIFHSQINSPNGKRPRNKRKRFSPIYNRAPVSYNNQKRMGRKLSGSRQLDRQEKSFEIRVIRPRISIQGSLERVNTGSRTGSPGRPRGPRNRFLARVI